MTELPEWVTSSPDFDPSRWYMPLVCTHQRRDGVAPSDAPLDLLTVLVQNAEGDVGWLVTVYAAGEHFPVSDEELAAARAAGHRILGEPRVGRRTPPRVFSPWRRGSVNVTCPSCHATKRWPREDWAEFLRATPALDAPWVDLAALV